MAIFDMIKRPLGYNSSSSDAKHGLGADFHQFNLILAHYQDRTMIVISHAVMAKDGHGVYK